MEKILNKYRDNNGYIKNLKDLYYELINNKYSNSDIIKIFNNIYLNNKKILNNIKSINENNKRIIETKNINNINNYVKKEKIVEHKIKKDTKSSINNINIEFYIDYINNNIDNDKFIDILPKDNSKDSIMIIDTILAYYLKEINFLEYNLINEKDEDTIKLITDELLKYRYLLNKLIDYKNNLNTIKENTLQNNLVYFMENDIPYIFKDITDIDNLKSIIRLLQSIENGNFLNIKAFTGNEKLKGLFEVRDLSKRNRVIFEHINGGKYCIICSIINKTETNSKYKENLYNNIKKYRENNNLQNIETKTIKKLFLGDTNE